MKYICPIVFKLFNLTICFFIAASLQAKDSTRRAPGLPERTYRNAGLIGISYARHTPLSDMKVRFGNSNTFGLAGGYKFGKKNWTISGGADIIFSSNVNENTMFDTITGPSGSMIDAQGNLAVVRLYERGYHFHFDFGRVIPLDRIHTNSGILFTEGVGFMQHKVKFLYTRTIMPQLEKDIFKGYDRLSNGLMLRVFLGYQRMEPDELFSFFAGIEYLRGFTRNRRELNYDTRVRDTRLRKDELVGLKFGVIIPILGRKAGTKKGEEEKFFE